MYNQRNRNRAPKRPIQPKPKIQPQRNPKRRAAPRTRMNSSVFFRDIERVATLSIPTTSAPGELLASYAVNPLSAPRLRAVAQQFDSWHGQMSMEVETTGNAFSKNYVILRHLPNGDPSVVPSNPDALLNTVEASARPGESARLQLDSNRPASVSARWSESYNKNKPIVDADLNDCRNGQFLIVSNGSPGLEIVTLTVRLRYQIRFFGPVYRSLIPDNSARILAFGSPPTPWNGATVSGNGSGYIAFNPTTATVTLPAGNYLFSQVHKGTGITTVPGATFVNCSGGASAFLTTATMSIDSYTVSVPSDGGQVKLGSPLTATTLASSSLFIAPFTA